MSKSIQIQSVKAVVLVRSLDFGRCPLASRLPTALWPVLGKSVLERLLEHLADQGIKKAVICGSGASSLLAQSSLSDDRLALSFVDEDLPVGTAGCVRDAVGDENNEDLLIAFPASIACPPEIEFLIKEHHNGQSDLTVMLNPYCQNNTDMDEASGIYVLNPEVLKYIPEEGYFDIKEGLIPKMLHASGKIHAARLKHHAGNFRNRKEYLYAVSSCLENVPKFNADLKPFDTDVENVWLAENAEVDSEARVNGPVVILNGASVSAGAVVLGPAVLEKNAAVDRNSIVINSVLWDDARVGPNCNVQGSVVDYHTVVRDNADIKKKFVILTSGFVLIAFLWSYWPGLVELWKLWRLSDEYSSGLLVPFLAVYVLWSRHADIARCPVKPSVWGLFAFAGAQAVRFFGLFLNYSSAERLSVVLSIAALVLFLFGWKIFRKISPILLFLCLMLPLPNVVQYYVGLNLQRWATSSAVFCLEVIGYAVTQDGHTIDIGNVSVAVLEACNGLRMITAFFVISGLVVLLVKRTWWEKLVILVSSLPIALLCNTVRLAVTAMFFTILKGEYWEQIFHDFGGYAMMPLALAAVVGELWLLAKLTVLPAEEKAIIITRKGN